MGAWDNTIWGNDSAADWFCELFEKTKLREKVRECLEMDMNLYCEDIRAAAYILIVLGRTYIWSGVQDLDDDLSLAIKRMEELQQHSYYNLPNDFGNHLKYETAILKHRLDKDYKLPTTMEFKNWWLSFLK
jgi:hypothetical protein